MEYSTSLQHLLAELERLDLLIRVEVWRARRSAGADEELAGLHIAEDEPDALLDRPLGAPTWATTPLPPDLRETVQATLDRTAADVAERTAASVRAGVPLRLLDLARRFGLGAFDVDVVLACLGPELDQRYERLYAYLNDDVTRPRPTVGLVLDLLCPDLPAKVALRSRFGPAAPLVRHRLVLLGDQADHHGPALLGRSLRLDRRVASYLLGEDEPDERLRAWARLLEPAGDAPELVFPDAFAGRLAQLQERIKRDGDDLVVYCQGPAGVGKASAAAARARELGRALLVVDGRRMVALDPNEFETMAGLADREARLLGALLHWAGFDALLAPDKAEHLARLLPILAARPGPTFLAGDVAWEPVGALRDAAFARLEFPPPGYPERLRLWRAALAGEAAGDARPDLDLAALAGGFRLSGGQIRDAVATARNQARTRDAPGITQADLLTACRLRSNHGLVALAQAISPRYSWDDIVLPAGQMAQLREIHDQVRNRALVYGTWGFDGKLALGKGLAVLFAGPPGTGKTMAADVLAGALGLDLYKIDLSRVMSKYIGDTEKHLARIFAEARTSNAILFFDEADALFGKRTQVRDAHDRYANVEISFLLQQLEEYDGVVVLATNLRKNMDEAFVRRLHVTVDFPVPGVADRRRIWGSIWPEATPLDPDLDLDLLAERVDVAGGSIRNIALTGAFLAAADGGEVGMRHLIQATQREYQKLGKVLTPGDFGTPRGGPPASRRRPGTGQR
jgi:hypothetical protein